jgi:hypothetical protein
MNISITKEEFDAIYFALGQVESDLESSEDDEFNMPAKQSIKAIYRFCEKYKKARFKEEQTAGLIAECKKQGKQISRKEATRVLRKYKII